MTCSASLWEKRLSNIRTVSVTHRNGNVGLSVLSIWASAAWGVSKGDNLTFSTNAAPFIASFSLINFYCLSNKRTAESSEVPKLRRQNWVIDTFSNSINSKANKVAARKSAKHKKEVEHHERTVKQKHFKCAVNMYVKHVQCGHWTQIKTANNNRI